MKARDQSPSVYEQWLALPEHLVGEIVDGELTVTPRPRPEHANVTSELVTRVRGQFGGGGSSGWRILFEPELHLGEHIMVPDIAGWRRQRLPELPKEAHFELPPDWVCEILSDGTARHDRDTKMPRYAEFGVQHAWLIAPVARTLEVYRLDGMRWTQIGVWIGNAKVRAEPFEALELDLAALWEG